MRAPKRVYDKRVWRRDWSIRKATDLHRWPYLGKWWRKLRSSAGRGPMFYVVVSDNDRE